MKGSRVDAGVGSAANRPSCNTSGFGSRIAQQVARDCIGRGDAELLRRDGNLVSSVASGEIDSHGGAWTNFTSGYLVPVGAESVTYEMEFIRHVGSDNDSFIDDNSLTLSTATGATTPTVTPEPSSFALLGTGLLGAMGVVRRRLA